MNPEKIGKLIAYLRKEKHLTQSQLENIIKVDRRTISKWENGKLTPDSSILLKLSKTFDITVEELLEGKLENKSNNHISNNKLKKMVIFILCILIICMFTGVAIHLLKPDDYKIYTISSELNDFQLDGQIRYKKSNCYVQINRLLYTNIYIGTDKEITTSKVIISLLENDRTLITETFEDKEKNNINYYLENVRLEYDDKDAEVKIKNPKNLVLNITYFNSKNEQQYFSVKLISN